MISKHAVFLCIAISFVLTARGDAQITFHGDAEPWSARIAKSFLERHPGAVTYDSASPDKRWNYEQGLMLIALLRMGEHTGDSRYSEFVRRNLDAYVTESGAILSYEMRTFNLDNIAPGRALLRLYELTGEQKYRAAAETLRTQISLQPRTRDGGFWHKQIYPYQMWLDGLFMAEPFYAGYARVTRDTAAWSDIARQFLLAAAKTRDSSTGLLYHAWDASRQQRWSDSLTGRSPHFWARSLGWYVMGLVEVLEVFPENHPDRPRLVQIFRDLAGAIRRYRDRESKLWYQVVDLPQRKGNYLEASASCMFAYAFARGARLGLLDASFRGTAEETFRGITSRLVSIDPDGKVNLHDVCRSAGLGGNPYRDGSFTYYVSEPRRTNDMKGVGAWLLAAIELESQRGGTAKP